MEKTQGKVKQVNIGLGKRINASKEFQEQTRLRKSFERKLRGQMIVYFGKLYDKVADNYEMIEPYEQVLKDTQDNLFRILNSHYRVVIEKFGERQLRNYQKQNLFEEIYQDYVRQVGATRVVAIQNSTRNVIRRVINTNIDEGVEVTGKKIRDQGKPFNSFNRYRSNTIARTETHNAASYANHKVVESLNIPDVQKRWTTTLDARSRTTHVQANGQTVGMDEDFTVGGRPMAYPGDPRGGAANVINCRCVLLYVTLEDVVTDDTTTTPKPRQARATEDTSQQQVMGFGRTIPEEKVWHEVSWGESPDNIKNAIYTLPALSRVTTERKGAFYMNRENRIEMGKYKITQENGKDVWRHEYGHDIDSKALGILKGYSDKDKFKNLEIRKNKFGRSAYISEYYADEALRDQKNIKKIFANTYGVNRYSQKGSKIMDDIDNKVEKKMAKQIGSEKIDDKWLDNNLQDGKIFTKEEIITIVGGRKKIKEFHESGSPAFNEMITRTNKRVFLELNELNKEGVFDFKDGFRGSLRKLFILEDQINKSERSLLFQDFIGSLTNANLGDGHGKSYYNKKRGQGTIAKRGFSFGNAVETFANYTSLKGIDNDLWYKKMRKYAPETTKAYDDVFDELNNIAIEDPIGLVD
jgi:hypothetical protein